MIDPVLVFTGVACFSAGLTLGWIAQALYQDRKSRMPQAATRKLSMRDFILIALVGVVLAANIAIGLMQIENGRQDRQRTECSIKFNERQALALDERGARASDQTLAEIELWRGVKAALNDRSSDAGPTAAVSEIDEYVRELRRGQKSRIENPYPPADLCN